MGTKTEKAKRVKFGRPPKPLPKNFYEVYQKWKGKKLSMNQAAESCGLTGTTFFEKAEKFGKV